jgi:hypothetical protein
MKRLWILLVILLVMVMPAQGAGLEDFQHCLTPYEPLFFIAYENVDGVRGWNFQSGVSGPFVQLYIDPDDTVLLVVSGQQMPCALQRSEGDLPTITLYPLGGAKWTWAIQDEFGNWHTVKLLTGEIVETPPEYDTNGRMFTRLVIRRNEPTDPTRYHIFDENGNIAG